MHEAPAEANCSPRLFASASRARRASYGFAYSGFNTSGPAAGGDSFGSAPRPPRYTPHTPERSGGLAGDWAGSCKTAIAKSKIVFMGLLWVLSRSVAEHASIRQSRRIEESARLAVL